METLRKGIAMFERFTDRARRAVVIAQEEARTLKHLNVDVEHLLFGLTDKDGGVAASALNSHGATAEAVHTRIHELVGEGEYVPSANIPFTHAAKKTLARAKMEALQLGHSYIGTEHLLLALIRASEGNANDVLRALNVDTQALRTTIIEEMSGFRTASSSTPGRPTVSDPWIRSSTEIAHDIDLLRSRLAGLEEELAQAHHAREARTDVNEV